jgi:UDP-N-acetylglucosamine 2-epimerase (non-hydrolysing)
VLTRLGLEPRKYFLVTMHREENVDVEARLRSLVASFAAVQREYKLPVIVSTHPRTRAVMSRFAVDQSGSDDIQFHEPFGLFDFIKLERNARCVLSDSGTVQEECCLYEVANVTIRDVTERPETLECGSNMLSGAEPGDVLRCVRTVLEREPDWEVPAEYLASHVSSTVIKILLGYQRQPTRRC